MTAPTKSTPAGCFIGTLAILPGGVMAAGGFGLVKWFVLPADARHFDHVFWTLLGATAGGLLGVGLLLAVAIRVLRATDFRNYDPNDPDRTRLKW
ncbi:MAG: hypothetical protein ABIS50_21540 [Luteolibacter sp.]|uniref:hypothetical protein n=1 Tax=Luteolibacter sp. TaxID=1962973 RepID=UPI0032674CAE